MALFIWQIVSLVSAAHLGPGAHARAPVEVFDIKDERWL